MQSNFMAQVSVFAQLRPGLEQRVLSIAELPRAVPAARWLQEFL
jgi:hypothetical protein